MALVDTTWYTNAGDQSTTGYYAVAKRPQNTAVVAGQLCRQFTAPTVGNERVFICIIAGTTANVTDATWVLTRGAKTTDGTATWMECTGQAGLNGDLTNTATWAQVKAATPAVLGQVIKRSNNASYQICTTAGAMSASEPAFSDTAGVTTTDTTAVWTSLGVVGNFTGGQAPFARLASACASTWFAAGNTVYVGDNHAESQASGITIVATSAHPLMGKFLCHNHSGSYPPASGNLTTGASIATTGANNISFTSGGGSYFYGLTWKAGAGLNSTSAASITITPAANGFMSFDNCSFRLENVNASNSSLLQTTSTGNVPNSTVFNNCTAYCGGINQTVTAGTGQFVWQNTGQVLASGSSVPATFFTFGAVNVACPLVTFEGLDLSQLTGNLQTYTSGIMTNPLVVKDCKLNAAVTIVQPGAVSTFTQLVRCDSGATAYKSTRYAYEGTETTETSITRVGGAADPAGQAQSRKIVTTANSQWLRPFRAEPYAIWNAVTGSNVTVTVCGTVNSGTLPLNDEIWLEAEYIGNNATLGIIVNTTKSNLLAANAAVAADGSVWNNAVSSAIYSTWDSGTLGFVTLSGGDLVATNTGTTSTGQGAHVASTAGFTTGKYYFEVTQTVLTGGAANQSHGVGIGTPTSTYTGMDVATTGVVMFQSGSIYANGSSTGVSTGSSVLQGHIIRVAVDLDNRKIWFRNHGITNWNGNAGYDPATNVGGVTIPAGTMVPFLKFGGVNGTSGNVQTANFGASAFVGTVPSGFTSGWGTVSTWSPFKLTTTLNAPQPGMAGYIHARVRAAKPSTTWYIDPQITLG